MSNSVIRFDDNDISVLGNSNGFEVEASASKYSEELYSLNYIEGVFKAIESTMKDSQYTLSSAKKFLQDNVDFPEQIALPEITDINIDYQLPDSHVIKSFEDHYSRKMLKVNLNDQGSSLKFRTGPSGDSEVIDRLKHDDEVILLDDDMSKEWILVKSAKTGEQGYVNSGYVREIS